MKHSFLTIYLILFYFSLPQTSLSQILGLAIKPDSAYPRLNILFNPIEPFFCDASIFAEIQNSPDKLFGASLGYIYPIGTNDINYFFLTDKYYELFCFKGVGLRLYEKIFYKNEKYLDFARGKKRYISPVLLVRYMYYNHLNFSYTDDDGDVTWHLNQSEKTWVVGMELLFGKHSDSRKKVFVDQYWGFGVRLHFRNYTVYDDTGVYQGNVFSSSPQESFSQILIYPTLHIGLKIGYVAYKK